MTHILYILSLCVFSMRNVVVGNPILEALGDVGNHALPKQLYFYNIGRNEESPHAIENCYGAVLKQSFNDIDYALLGYNALRGYPLHPGRDPGFTYPIFKANYSAPRFTADCRYSLPQGIIAMPEVSCTTSFTSTEVKTETEFSNSLSVAAEVSGGGWGVSFGASAGYKSAVSEMKSGESIFILSQAQCQYYIAELDPISAPPLDDNFIVAVRRLNNGNQDAYMDFIDTYGTHFVTSMDFGARFTKQHKMSISSYNKAKDSSFSVGVQASYSGLFSVGGGFNLDSEQRQAALNFQKSVETTSITVGATPPASGDAMEWASSVKLNPMPMNYKLSSIENLFSDHYMGDLGLNLGTVKNNIVRYKAQYCSSVMGSNTAACTGDITDDPCDPSPCQNSGVCYREGGSRYNCYCDNTHGGVHCEITCNLKHWIFCFWMPENNGNWISSDYTCKKAGGHLAEVDGQQLQDALANYYCSSDSGSLFWLDGKLTAQNTWEWHTSGRPVTYTSWHTGQPDNYNGMEGCMQLACRGTDKKWNDNSCEFISGKAICQHP